MEPTLKATAPAPRSTELRMLPTNFIEPLPYPQERLTASSIPPNSVFTKNYGIPHLGGGNVTNPQTVRCQLDERTANQPNGNFQQSDTASTQEPEAANLGQHLGGLSITRVALWTFQIKNLSKPSGSTAGSMRIRQSQHAEWWQVLTRELHGW